MDTRSYWQVSLDREPLPTVALPATAEVVVIGAGVLGACTALWLSHLHSRPLVLDMGGVAAGASGRNGGLLVSGTAEGYREAIARWGHAHARAVWSLSVAGVAQLRNMALEEAIDAGIETFGNLSFALDEAHAARQRATVEQLRADGFAAEWLDRTAVQQLVTTPLGAEVVGARLNPTAASLHSGRLVHGLMAAAQRRGAQLCVGAQVQRLSAAGSGVAIHTTQGVVQAQVVLVAANAWSGDIIPELAQHITPVRGQALVTEPLPPLLKHGFGVGFTPTGEYGQQRPDGRIVYGGCRALAPDRDVGVRELTTDEQVQTGLDTTLRRLFPSLQHATIERRWSGTMGFSNDYMPVAGKLADLPVWYAGGFCGHGMPFAAPLGRALAAAAMGDPSPQGLALFHPERASKDH